MTRQEIEHRIRSIKHLIYEETQMATKKAPAAPAAAAPATNSAKAPAPVAAPAPEVDPNQVTLAELCKEVGTTGTVARRKLRAAKMTKEGRWAWKKGSKELEQVRELITPKADEGGEGEGTAVAAN